MSKARLARLRVGCAGGVATGLRLRSSGSGGGWTVLAAVAGVMLASHLAERAVSALASADAVRRDLADGARTGD
jgi:hypothetical protein